MSRVPPAPPPPPLPAVHKIQLSSCKEAINPIITSCSVQMEASRMCEHLFSSQYSCLAPENGTWISSYSRVQPVLQKGPSCGPAALCMASQLIEDVQKSPRGISLEYAIEVARKRGYTCRGEMFSASDMRLLAEELLECHVELLSNGFDEQSKIIHHLAMGLPILVPYDADANHEPSCRQGHKAHWSVLLGLVFKTRRNVALPSGNFTMDPSLPRLCHVLPSEDADSNERMREVIINEASLSTEIFVYAKQGKSNHTSLWNIESLARSNANLHELSPKRRDSIHQYVIPKDGVCSGLCGKVLLLG